MNFLRGAVLFIITFVLSSLAFLTDVKAQTNTFQTLLILSRSKSHPLGHLNAEKIETVLQNSRGKITQR